eukprot:364988-Chlamydomonas_euryale.AAC.4
MCSKHRCTTNSDASQARMRCCVCSLLASSGLSFGLNGRFRASDLLAKLMPTTHLAPAALSHAPLTACPLAHHCHPSALSCQTPTPPPCRKRQEDRCTRACQHATMTPVLVMTIRSSTPWIGQ